MKFSDAVKNNPFLIIFLLLSVFFSIITWKYSGGAAIAELSAVIFIAVLSFNWFRDTTRRKIEEVKALSSSLKTGDGRGKELENFPFPVVLTDTVGDIIWFNNGFERLIPDFGNLNNKNLFDILPKDGIFSGNNSPIEITGQKQQYSVYASLLDDGLYVFYWVEDTALKDIRNRYYITRPAVLLINIDSLESAEDVMPHEEYYGLNSDVDRIVTKWLAENDCIFRRFSDGRFFAVTEQQYLDGMKADRFMILDKIRNEHFGGEEIDITLSIGVGLGESLSECEDNAREALDMARGRGGDQVAVKSREGYEFFGGLSAGKEKRGKVKARAFAAALDSYIENAADVLCMGHINSDFDALGACVGIAAIVRAKGKNVHVVVNRSKTMAMPLIRMMESGAGAVGFISSEKALSVVTPGTLLIVCDTMQENLVETRELLNRGLRTVVIDHHRRKPENEIKGNTFEFLEPHASSASEMVTELVEYSPSKPKLSATQAQALLAGILLDTKNFTLRVGVRTFEAATYLKECKADTVQVKKLFSQTPQINVAVNNTVNSAVYYKNYAIALSGYYGNDAKLVAAKAADELLTIEGVDASFVITPLEKVLHISARSLGKINVQLIMEKMGGGGHHSMAAAQMEGVKPEDAVLLVRKTVDEFLSHN